MNEVERDTYFRRSAINWVVEHQSAALNLYIQKVLNYFNYHNELATKSESSSFRDLVLFFTYYPLLVLSILRLFFSKQYPMSRREIILYLFYFGNSFLSAIFFTSASFLVSKNDFCNFIYYSM